MNRTMQVEFLQSRKTINRYFNDVLSVVCLNSDEFVQPPWRTCGGDSVIGSYTSRKYQREIWWGRRNEAQG